MMTIAKKNHFGMFMHEGVKAIESSPHGRGQHPIDASGDNFLLELLDRYELYILI
jgi:hypothetical protein